MIDVALVILLVASALVTVMTARLIRSAVALAVTSAVLAAIMFRLDSSLAAVFELSVCAGLIPAIFISVVGLTRRLGPEDLQARMRDRLRRYWILPVLVIVVAAAFSQVSFPADLVRPSVGAETDPRNVLWNLRHLDLLGQAVMLLGAAFAVVVLLKEARDE